MAFPDEEKPNPRVEIPFPDQEKQNAREEMAFPGISPTIRQTDIRGSSQKQKDNEPQKKDVFLTPARQSYS